MPLQKSSGGRGRAIFGVLTSLQQISKKFCIAVHRHTNSKDTGRKNEIRLAFAVWSNAIRKRKNRGSGYGLEVPCEYPFQEAFLMQLAQTKMKNSLSNAYQPAGDYG